jgi:predicted metal-dependent hydrolase
MTQEKEPIPWTSESEEGVRLFNRGEYREAQEAWEGIRAELDGSGKKFYQGLIQLAAGYTGLKQRQHKEAAGNLRKGFEKFRGLDDAAGDLGVPIDYQKLINQSRGVRVSLLDQGEERLAAREWDIWPKIEYRE